MKWSKTISFYIWNSKYLHSRNGGVAMSQQTQCIYNLLWYLQCGNNLHWMRSWERKNWKFYNHAITKVKVTRVANHDKKMQFNACIFEEKITVRCVYIFSMYYCHSKQLCHYFEFSSSLIR